jgi:aminoglycoside 2''-phosphotransferase
MNVDSAREALVALGAELPLDQWQLEPEELLQIEPIIGGWSYSTFRVGSRWVVRFPRNERVAACLEREIRLLPSLAEHVSYAVPVPGPTGRHRGLPFSLSRWIPGRPVSGADVTSGIAPSPEHAGERRARLARVLAELHGFPNRRAAELLELPLGVEAWRARYAELREDVERRVHPLLETPLRDRLTVAYRRFEEAELASFRHPVLVHADLGVEHVLVDEAGFVTGMLDFEEACLGDPAIDFVGLQIAFGDDVVRDVVARYGGPPDPGFVPRLRFYCAMGSVHAILHGLDEADDAIVSDGISELARRLEVREAG